VITSNWIAGCVIGAIGFLIAAIFLPSQPMLNGALVFGLMIPPLSRIYYCERGWPRNTIIAICAVMGALGLFAVGLFIARVAMPSLGKEAKTLMDGFAALFFLPYLLLALGSQFAVNALMAVRVKK
jgi:hypothetical protein